MQISKNKIYQFIFFAILSLYIFFNGGNSNLLLQVNFVITSTFFYICLKDKNYKLHFKNFYLKNKLYLIFYFFFLIYLFIQLVPFPVLIIKFISTQKFEIISNLSTPLIFTSISFSPTETYFQLLNYITLIFVIFIFKIIFYKDLHIVRFHLFLSFSGFIASIVGLIFYLNGNPDILFIKNSSYVNASSGFFVNRTVLSVFLLFSLISSLILLKNLAQSKKDYYISLIYVRLFLIFITIGIITTFSRIGNFLLIITVATYLFNEFFFSKNKNQSFKIIIIVLILFDIFVLGLYFGTEEIIDRFLFLKEELLPINNLDNNISRLEIIKFSAGELNNNLLFGYGAGAYSAMFQNNFNNSSNLFANHAHSDAIEFLGEFGLIGLLLLTLSLKGFFKLRNIFILENFVLIIYCLVILSIDFSLHIPLIQICFLLFFSIKKLKLLS